ncbi:MAG: ABC transporter permease [Cyclobacteriaceae bacterium]
MNKLPPPKFLLRFFRGFCHPDLHPFIEGDLLELYEERVSEKGKRKANIRFALDVLLLFRPGIIRPFHRTQSLNRIAMYKNYFIIGWRNLFKHKGYSLINISGLTVGMAVAILIGLWILDEWTFNRYYKNYSSIAKVMLNYTLNGEVRTGKYMSLPIAPELKESYRDDFQYVVMSTFTREHSLAVGEKTITQSGIFMEHEAPHMLSLSMLKGTRDGLKDPHSIFLSASLANTLFGSDDPINQVVRINDKIDVKVTGVYQDMPQNTEFSDLAFLGSWQSYVAMNPWVEYHESNWNNNFIRVFTQIAPNTTFDQVAAKIKDVKFKHLPPEEAQSRKPEVFLHPMSQWHLYSEFENGEVSGGLIQFVWLFGIIGGFVLLLACINFMNLSTARSQQRAREVGVRKAVGSGRGQLITQFFSESLLVVIVAFILALLMAQLALPLFNQLSGKSMVVVWSNPTFWLLCLGFCLFPCLLAGSYPAFYLSSFKPVKVLKGGAFTMLRMGGLAVIPRKVLVVLQFAVSMILIIGTAIVFRQIQFTQDRPVGYDQRGLVYTSSTVAIHEHFDAFRNDLLNTGAIVEVAESNGALTEIAENNGDFTWQGKDPDFREGFGLIRVSHDYGKTVDWQLIEGRDFSRSLANGDTNAFILNESAVELMGLENPIGEIVKHGDQDYQVIGVVKDMVMRSPYDPARPSIFSILPWQGGVVSFKLHPSVDTQQALAEIKTVFKAYAPSLPFNYKFVNQEYAKKFGAEQRIGKLSSIFAILAIFISCLGLFGLASFVVEQRIKEIGIRKVLGASVIQLWQLLSKDFVALVIISCLLAIPIAYYFLHSWLQNYEYRTEISWWIFASASVGALVITLLTVSFQSLKAALVNPVDSLRNE